MRARLVGSDRCQRRRVAAAKRPARGGEDDAGDAVVPGGAVDRQALVDGGVLAVDRQQGRAALRHGSHEQRATDDQRLLVGQEQTLAGRGGGQAGRQPRRADDRCHDGVCLRMRGELAQGAGAAHHLRRHARVAQTRREGARFARAGDGGVARPKAQAEREQLVEAAAGRQREDLEAIGMGGDDVERCRADRAGRTEHADALHFASRSFPAVAHSITSARAIGNTGSKPSTRSRMPPWPGSSALLSLAPALRLTSDSNRSPTTLIATRKTTISAMPA